jgi:hypothetical protein
MHMMHNSIYHWPIQNFARYIKETDGPVFWSVYIILFPRLYTIGTMSLCTWWLGYRKLQVMFKVSPTSLQTFIDTPNCVLKDRVRYSMVHILNVFCDGRLQINCVGIVRIPWVFVL